MAIGPAPTPTRALLHLNQRREPNTTRSELARSSSGSPPQFQCVRCTEIGLQGIFSRRGVDWDRIATGEATEAPIPLPRRTQEPIETEIPQGIGSEMAANLLQIPAMSDQTLALPHVDPEMTGVSDRRRRDAEVDGRGAAPP